MKAILSLVIILGINAVCLGQQNNRISTIDFVQILNDNTSEATYYYENNWRALREMAMKKAYIHSFQLLETPFSKEAPFHMMLITTYENKQQYDLREDRFSELIKERGALRLMNEKKPGEFRKTVFNKDPVRHWE